MTENVLSKEEKKEVKSFIRPEEIIEGETALAWDGKNIMIRIPRDVANYFGIHEKNRFEKMILFRVREHPDGTIEKTFDIIKREKPKRKIKKNGKKKTPTKKR